MGYQAERRANLSTRAKFSKTGLFSNKSDNAPARAEFGDRSERVRRWWGLYFAYGRHWRLDINAQRIRRQGMRGHKDSRLGTEMVVTQCVYFA